MDGVEEGYSNEGIVRLKIDDTREIERIQISMLRTDPVLSAIGKFRLFEVRIDINSRSFTGQRILAFDDITSRLDQMINDMVQSLKELIAGELKLRMNEEPLRDTVYPTMAARGRAELGDGEN